VGPIQPSAARGGVRRLDRDARALRSCLLSLLLAHISACASSHSYSIETGHEGASSVDSFLLLPCNLVVELPPQLVDSPEIVDHEIARYLRSHGRSVHRIARADARRLWIESIAAAKEAGLPHSFESATPFLSARLRASGDYDALLIPSLLLENLRVRGRGARWEGVQRSVRFIGVPADRGSLELSRSFQGELPAVTLHVMVLDREDARVFQGRGGVDLIHEVDLSDVVETGSWRLQLRRDPLGDRARLREGIALALSPYLPTVPTVPTVPTDPTDPNATARE
jgi:hypothetical protein